MNGDHLDQGDNDLNLNIINNKIKTEFEQFIDDHPPPLYSPLTEKEKADEITSSAKYHDYLENEAATNETNLIANSELDCKLNKLNNEFNNLNCDNQAHQLSMPLSSLYSDLYGHNSLHNQNLLNVRNQTTMSNTGNLLNQTDSSHCLNNSQIYQTADTNKTVSMIPSQQQSALMNKISLSNNTLKLPFDHHHLNSPMDNDLSQKIQQQQQQTIYTQINQSLLNNLDQQINEIYQYAASDQLSQLSKSSDSDAAYSTLKLLDTASCNSSLVGGINEQQLLKCTFPPIYTPSNYLTTSNNNNEQSSTTETDSGYTFSSQNNNNKQNTNSTMINVESDYIQGLKNQINQLSKLNQLNQLNQFNQLNQQLNSPAECLYQSNNFVRSRTALDLNNSSDTLPLSSLSNNQNLNTSVSTYSFVNLGSNQDDLISSQFPNKNSFLTYSPANDITVLSSTLPSSSTKEALLQQQLSNSNLVIMTNCNDSLGPNQTTNSNLQDNWYKMISRRLRDQYLSKRKIQDSSSFNAKKHKLDSLDDKKTMNSKSSRLFYQSFLVRRCSLVPCLLIFACALLLFVVGLFTLLNFYFYNQQNLLNDQLLLTNSHTQLQGNSINKLSNTLNGLSSHQHTTPASATNYAMDVFNKFVLGLTSVVKSVTLSGTNNGYQIPNSLTTGDSSSNKNTVQTENQAKLKQYQTVNWFKSAIFYEVFVASFQDSNGDGVGDIDGLISRLAYIKELGVTAIRLNSIFSALDYPYQYSNILNHTEIEKQLGTMSDFRRLVQNCHNIGLRIVLDLNPCLTSDQHRWATHFHRNKTDDSHNYYVNTSDYASTPTTREEDRCCF